jgi:hypothetical protein
MVNWRFGLILFRLIVSELFASAAKGMGKVNAFAFLFGKL